MRPPRPKSARVEWERSRVMNFNHLFAAGHCAPSAAFVAVRLMGEGRAEWEKLLSLVEAGLTEALAAGQVEAVAESEAWKRAVNIGKVVRELAAANVERLLKAERQLALQALAERGREQEAG